MPILRFVISDTIFGLIKAEGTEFELIQRIQECNRGNFLDDDSVALLKKEGFKLLEDAGRDNGYVREEIWVKD